MENEIYLNDDIRLTYQIPKVFSNYLSIYYAHRHGHYYFRSSTSMIVEKCEYLDSCYFIYQGEKIIGGVILKPNFMTDLFVVPPFINYEFLVEKLLSYLKRISTHNEKIVISQVLEEYTHIYKKLGCKITESEYFMIRPTEEMDIKIPSEYFVKPLDINDKSEIAEVIMAAYENNPCYITIDTKERYISHVESVFNLCKKNEALYKGTRIIIHEKTNEIVGTCFLMEFEGYPLIMSLTVRPDHQGFGLGSFLLRNAIHSTNSSYPAIRLSVLANNPVVKFYEHIGFMKTKSLDDMVLI